MRRKRPPRTPLQRLALITAALGTVVLGYWLGNRYQFGELQNSSAILMEQPVEIDTAPLPNDLQTQIKAEEQWVILLAGENGKACDQLLNHYIEVVNRLAAWPKIQARIRLALLDGSGRVGSPAWQQLEWADSHNMQQADILALTSALGIAPIGNRWCKDVQATTALLGPGNVSHALLPLDKPAEIAESLRLIIQAFDPDV